MEDLKGNPNQSLSRHLPKLPPPFFQTPWIALFIMVKLEMAENINVKMWKKCHLILKCLLAVGYPTFVKKSNVKKYPIRKWIVFPISIFSIIRKGALCSVLQMGSSMKVATCNFPSNKTKKYSMQTSDAFETFYS